MREWPAGAVGQLMPTACKGHDCAERKQSELVKCPESITSVAGRRKKKKKKAHVTLTAQKPDKHWEKKAQVKGYWNSKRKIVGAVACKNK